MADTYCLIYDFMQAEDSPDLQGFSGGLILHALGG